MEITNYQFINQVDPSKDKWRVKARIERIWDAIDFRNSEEVLSLDMILLDENEDQIHAVMPKKLISKYETKIKGGGIFVFEMFNVSINKGNYRPVKNEYKIYFKWSTIIRPAEGETTMVPRYKFTFIEFEDLPLRYNDDQYLTDVIGRLTGICNIRSVQKANGQAVQMREIMVENISGSTLNITLWGKAAYQMDDCILEDTTNHVIIITTSTVVKMYRGAYNLWSTNATKLYINLAISEVATFKDRCTKTTSIGLINTTNNCETSIVDALFQNRRTISELSQSIWDATGKENTYTCKASITKIIDDYGWYYMSCKICRKKVKKNDSKMWCHTCDTEVLYPIPRYMLRMKVQDYSGSTTFVAFDKEVEKLIHRPATDLLAIYKMENGPEKVSAILNDVINYERVFLIKLTEYNMQQGNKNFTAAKIFLVDIMLECKYAQEQMERGGEERIDKSAVQHESAEDIVDEYHQQSESNDEKRIQNESSNYNCEEYPFKKFCQGIIKG